MKILFKDSYHPSKSLPLSILYLSCLPNVIVWQIPCSEVRMESTRRRPHISMSSLNETAGIKIKFQWQLSSGLKAVTSTGNSTVWSKYSFQAPFFESETLERTEDLLCCYIYWGRFSRGSQAPSKYCCVIIMYLTLFSFLCSLLMIRRLSFNFPDNIWK